MKKPSVKDLFAVGGVILFVSAGIWIVAQSNANDEAPIMIDTNKYTATQHIQEVHLNDTSSSKKIGLKNQDGLVLGVGSVGVDERVGKLKNDAGGASAVIAGSGNGNWGSESSLIVGGENNQLANGKIGSVVMGGKANQVDSSETVVLASKDSATHGTGAVVVAVDRGEVFGENSLSFAGDAIVRRNDSMVIGSAVMMNGEGSFVFNGREQQGIIVDTDHSFIVGANNGLIIGTNKNNGSGIGLTVNGAVKVGEARGNDNMQTGAIFRVACSSPAGASCLCANISGQVKSISSNPACDNVCAGKSKQCFLDAKCGTRAITYAAAETTRRANTDFCTVGSHVQGADPRFPNVGEVSWTCVSDFGGASANCSAKKKLLPKEDAKCGSYHGMNFMAASLTNWPAGGTFCEKGVPTPTIPAFPKTGKPVSWTCGGENLNTVPCSANGCNRCSKEGFPYCFPVDFGPSCGSTPTQPVNGQCGTSKDSCASGDFVDITDTATDYKWRCNGKNGGTSVACSLKKPTQPVNGKCGTSKDSCASGDFVDATDTATDYKWQCNGKNGGSSVACSLKKPTQPVNGKCAGSVAVPVDGTKLVDYAKANPSLFCDPGTLVSPELSNGKLTWKCAGLNGGEPSQTCTASCPSGYSLQNGACVNKCFDSNQLKFHNIDFITKTSDNTYKIEVGTNGIHYGFFTYQGTGHGLVLSVIDDGGAPDLLEVPYGRFTNVLNIQRGEGIKNKDYSYKIKLMKQGCPEEIIFNVHQYKLHRCKLDGSPSFSVVYTDNVKHYGNVDVLKSMNRNGEVCFSDNHFGCLGLKDGGSTYDWIFNRVDLESSFLKNYLTENSYDPGYGSINFDFPIGKIHGLSSGDLEGCNLLNKSIKHTYGSPISHEAYGEIGWRIDEVGNVYIVGNWYPWKSPDKLSRKGNYVYLDGKEYGD